CFVVNLDSDSGSRVSDCAAEALLDRIVSLFSVGLSVVLAASAPDRVQACGGLPEATFQFNSVLPLDGAADVSPSAPLAFSLRCEPDESFSAIVREASCAHLPVFGAQLTLTRKGESEPVSGQFRAFGGRLVFVPNAPLAPDAEYVYVATLPGFEGGAGATLEGGFRTGSVALNPVRADGLTAPELKVYQGNAARCDPGDGDSVRLVGQAAD